MCCTVSGLCIGTETEDTGEGRELPVVRVECEILLFEVCSWTNSTCSLTDMVNSAITFSATADSSVARHSGDGCVDLVVDDGVAWETKNVRRKELIILYTVHNKGNAYK